MKVYKSVICRLLPVLMAVFLTAGCGSLSNPGQPGTAEAAGTAEMEAAETEGAEQAAEDKKAEIGKGTEDAEAAELPAPGLPGAFSLSMVPDYSGDIWTDINGDVPFFEESQMEAARRMVKILSLQNGQEEAEEAEEEIEKDTDTDKVITENQDQSDTSSDRLRNGSYQVYGDLDRLRRCTGACALVGPETLPQEARGQIGMIKPTGWHTVKYEGIDGNFLYNRCHLIGFQLTGQDANEKNLITGTRAMNVEGMLPYEDSVLAYVRGTGKHVLYRVTPVFRQDNLLADGVLMEACSVEDPLVRFCAFCYNVQPGIQIEYATGESTGPAFSGNNLPEKNLSEKDISEKGSSEKDLSENGLLEKGSAAQSGDPDKESGQTGKDEAVEDKKVRDNSVPDRSLEGEQGGSAIGEWKYIVNVSSMKFHWPGCESVQKMSRKNTQGFNGSREELIEMGYTPCKNCDP